MATTILRSISFNAVRIQARANNTITTSTAAIRSFTSSSISKGPRTLATPLASNIVASHKPTQAELTEHYFKFLDGDIYESNRSKVATHVTHYPIEEILEGTHVDAASSISTNSSQSNQNTPVVEEASSFGTYSSNGSNNVYYVDGRVAFA